MSTPVEVALLFPGQGSQRPGMGRDLAERYETARRTFEEAEEILRFPLSRLMWEGPEDELNDTVNTQPALYVHSLAAHRVLSELAPDLRVIAMAGHSLGELSALAASGALTFADGLRLVRRRGELMKRAGEISPGGMAAILGLDIPVLERVCEQASGGDEVVCVANDNCPGQVVVSGARPALERAMALAKEAGARRVVPLTVSIAAHSPLMAAVQEEFARAVEETPVAAPSVPVISNVHARPLETVDAIRADLRAQLTSRVRWTDSVRYLRSLGVTMFLELGSGNVLSGLLRRIDREAAGVPLGAPQDFERLLSELGG